MRRMYSEQELTKIIGEVFDQKLESGALNESIADAVDAYLVEHPVDITALEGQTIAPAIVNATTSMSAPSFSGVTEFENIKDSSGNKRFVEGNLSARTISGFTFDYAKWSLSGTHLMLVLAGSCESGTLADNTVLAEVALPSYIHDKIVPISGVMVDTSSFNFYKSGQPWIKDSITIGLDKGVSSLVIKNSAGAQTISNNAVFRITYDLLIDTAS